MNTFKTIALIFAVFTLFFNCSSDDSSSNASTPNTVNGVNTIVTNGTWRISYYYDTDHVETTNFTGYNFTFASGNVVTATNGTNTYTGMWSVTDSNSNDDSIDDLDFNLAFSSPANFADLSDDWDIISKTETEIKLIDVSGGNGGTDYLTFTKN